MKKLAGVMALLGMALLGAAPGWASDTVNGVKIARGAKVDIVFFTADDCPYCKTWKSATKESALKWTQSKSITFHEVNKPRIRQAYAAPHFPADAAFAWTDVKASGRTNFLIPRWIVYADNKPVMSASGLWDWNRLQRFADDVVEARDAK